MTVNCTHWQRQSWEHSGKCLLGLFGGFPSPGTCALCKSREAVDPAQPAVPQPKVAPPAPPGTPCLPCQRRKANPLHVSGASPDPSLGPAAASRGV